MSIYGSTLHEDVELVNEGFLIGLSNTGKNLKKEIKEEIKQYKEKFSFGKALSTKYDAKIQSSVEKLIKDKLKNNFVSTIILVTTTSSNGVTTESYQQQIVGFYKDNLYEIKVAYTATYAYLVSFNELNLEKCIIPKDVIEKALSQNRKDYLLHVSKNRISLENISSTLFDYTIFDKIIDYCESKHPDLKCKINKFTNSVSFKK